mmetsp:Transcript_156783/g.500285  ORF Transcript_156783/g.500285 Transcript_156783/m.500285 type:complete len:214 (-) Transcript_156783:534-1175(-)
MVRRGQLPRVHGRLGQDRGRRPRPVRRSASRHHRSRDPEHGEAHPSRSSGAYFAGCYRAAGRPGVVPRLRLQDSAGDQGLQPRRGLALGHLRKLAWLLGWHPRHVRRGAQVRCHDRRRFGGLQASGDHLHPAKRRVARWCLGRVGPEDQRGVDRNVRGRRRSRRHPGAGGCRRDRLQEGQAGRRNDASGRRAAPRFECEEDERPGRRGSDPAA